MTQVERKSRGSRFVAYALIGIMLTAMGYGMGVWSAPVTSFGIDGSGNFHGNEVHVNDVVSEGDMHTSSLYVKDELGNYENVTAAMLYPQTPAKVIVEAVGSTYTAYNGLTKAIISTGSTASTIIQAGINALTPSRTWKEKIVLMGNFTQTAPINVYSYTTLEIQGTLTSSADISGLVLDGSGGVYCQYIDIVGGNIINTNATNNYSGIYLSFGTFVSIDRVHVNGFNIGINVIQSYLGNSITHTFCQDNLYNSLRIDFSNSLYIASSRFVQTPLVGAGIWLTGGSRGSIITSSSIESCSGRGIYIEESWNNKILYNWFELNAYEAIKLNHASSKNNIISYNQFNNNDATGAVADIYVRISNNDTISYNEFTQKSRMGTIALETTNLITITGNTRIATGAEPFIIDFGATKSQIYRNPCFITENSGTATLLNTKTTIAVTHGLSYTPDADDISITFTEIPTNPITGWKVGTFTASTFNFTSVDPGASNLDFSWSAHKTP